MAAVGEGRDLRVDSNNYIRFLHAVDPGLKCQSCRFTLQNPLQTACGHRYCAICFEGILI